MVDGGVDAKVVAKVANGIGPLEGKLYTLVQDLAVVGEEGCHAAARCDGSVEHHVVRNPAVEVKFTAEAVVHKGEVRTGVGLSDHLPAEVVLVNRLGAHAVNHRLAEYRRRAHTGLAHYVHVVGGDVVVTKHTPAGAEFQVINSLALHERFVGNVPAKAHGREDAPLFLILGAAVGTEGNGCKVFLLIIIGTTGEGRHAVVAAGAVACVLVLVGAVLEVTGSIVIVRHVAHGAGKGCVVLHPGGLTQHGREGVSAYLIGISEGVVQDPVGAVAVGLRH